MLAMPGEWVVTQESGLDIDYGIFNVSDNSLELHAVICSPH